MTLEKTMTKQETLQTLATMHQADDRVVEYCDSQDWTMASLRAELKQWTINANYGEEVEDMTPAEWAKEAAMLRFIVNARKAYRFSDADLDLIAD